MKRRMQRTTLVKLLGFGAVSAALYGLLFTYSAPLTSLFAKGGAYCVLPVITVFIVSYFHAAFAGSVWSALGVVSAPRDNGRQRRAGK